VSGKYTYDPSHMYDYSQHYPYGEEITSTSNDTYKFAQTYRDSDSGLDYAGHRYYANSAGRFLTADPTSSANTQTPQSWNMYAYAGGDPVNNTDPNGTCWSFVNSTTGIDYPCNIDFNINIGLPNFGFAGVFTNQFANAIGQVSNSLGKIGTGSVDTSALSCSISVVDRNLEGPTGVVPGVRHGFIQFTTASGIVEYAEGQRGPKMSNGKRQLNGYVGVYNPLVESKKCQCALRYFSQQNSLTRRFKQSELR